MSASGTFLALNLLIQIPSDFSAAEQEALLASCNQAVEQEICLAVDATQEPQVRLERLSDERFMMEIVVETETRERLISREFIFKPEDDPVERARTLGLSAGLLSKTSKKALEPTNENSNQDQERKPPELRAETNLISQPSATGDLRPFYTEFGVGLGYEAGLHTLLPMGEIRLGYRPIKAFSFMVSAYFAGNQVEAGSTSMTVLHTAPVLGVGYQIFWGKLSLGVQLEAGAECLFLSSSNAVNQAARWSPIIRGGIPFQLRISARTYLIAAFRLNASLSTTVIYVDGAPIAATQSLRPSGLLGLGVEF